MDERESALLARGLRQVAVIAAASKMNERTRSHVRNGQLGQAGADRHFAPVTINGVEYVARFDSGADVSIMPRNLFALQPRAVQDGLADAGFPMTLLNYEGKEGGRPDGRVALFAHVFAQTKARGEMGPPDMLDGEQSVQFYVVPHGDVVTIGNDVLFKRGIFNDLSKRLLDLDCEVEFPAMLGPVVTPSDLPRPLNEAEDWRPATFLSPVPGDDADSLPLPDTSAARVAPRRYSRAEISLWQETQTDWPALKDMIVDYLYEHQELFGPAPSREASPLPKIVIDVKTVKDGPPILDGLSRYCPPAKYEKAMAAHARLEAEGFVATCTREELQNIFAHVYVWKKDGSIRCTLDVSTFNNRVERREVVMPDMRFFTTQMQGCSVFSDLDWRDFFFSFHYDDATSKMFGFVLPDGKTFARYLAMVMGLHNSPGIAQELANRLVAVPLRAEFNKMTVDIGRVPTAVHGIANYMDNSTLFSRAAVRPDPSSAETESLARKHFLEAVVPFLELSGRLGLRFKPNNSRLVRKTSQTLGTVTDGVTVTVDPERVAGYHGLEPAAAKTIKYVYHVRGLFSYYQRFVGTAEYARDVHLFTDMIVTHNRTRQQISTLWTAAHDAAFKRLRDGLLQAMPKYVLDPRRPLYAQMDASNVGWGGTLFQYDTEGYACPVTLFAYLWNENQKGYGTKEQECCAMVETMRMLRRLRLPTELVLRTDHNNLIYMRKSDSEMLRRWYFELLSYGYVSFQHIPGIVNSQDHPSRIATATHPAGEGSVPEPRFHGRETPLQHAAFVAAVATRASARRPLTFKDAVSRRLDARAAEFVPARPPAADKVEARPAAAGKMADKVVGKEALTPVARAAQEEVPPVPDTSTRVPGIVPTREPGGGGVHLPFLQRIADLQAALISAEELSDMKKAREFNLVGGSAGRPQYWTRKGKIVIPSTAFDMQREILDEGHERQHHGGEHDLQARTSHFYWKNKAEGIAEHIRSCPACQVNRAPRLGGEPGAPHINNSGGPFRVVIADHVPMGTKSIEGYTAFVTFTDAFTRWTEAYPVRSLSAPDTLSAFTYFRTRHSLPAVVQVDNHGAFKGEFAAYCREVGVTIKEIESYHAEANARGERQHGTIREKLRAYCSAGKYGLWAQALPFIMEACMTMHNRSLGMTPFRALYGRQHTSAFDLRVGAEFLGVTVEQYQDIIRAVHDELSVRDELRSDLQRSEMMKERGPAPTFKPGEKVVLWFPTRESKDHSYYQRGYEVVAEVRPDFYEIQRRELDGSVSWKDTVPVKRLRAYVERAGAPDGGMYMDIRDGHRVVDAIIGHTVRDERYRFKVRWKQYGPDLGDGENVTPYAELRSLMRNCKEMLLDYCEKNGIRYYKLERQRAAEAREARDDAEDETS